MKRFGHFSKITRYNGLRFTTLSFCLVFWTIAPHVSAGEYDEATWDRRAGDLIYRSGIDPFDDLIATCTGHSLALLQSFGRAVADLVLFLSIPKLG